MGNIGVFFARDRGEGAMSKTLFHYTQGYSAVMILRDGMIKRSTGETPPYVWLSRNPTNEPTACRIPPEYLPQPIRDDSRALFAFQGWARFVFQGFNAIPWQELPLTDADRDNLEQMAKSKGGRPEEWFALEDDVRSVDLPLEIETHLGWRKMAHADLKRQYEDLKTFDSPDGLLVVLPPHARLRLRPQTQAK
jgi:hypothetical protein